MCSAKKYLSEELLLREGRVFPKSKKNVKGELVLRGKRHEKVLLTPFSESQSTINPKMINKESI